MKTTQHYDYATKLCHRLMFSAKAVTVTLSTAYKLFFYIIIIIIMPILSQMSNVHRHQFSIKLDSWLSSVHLFLHLFCFSASWLSRPLSCFFTVGFRCWRVDAGCGFLKVCSIQHLFLRKDLLCYGILPSALHHNYSSVIISSTDVENIFQWINICHFWLQNPVSVSHFWTVE